MDEVVCVGIATLDRIASVARLPYGPGKYRARSRTLVGGGVAANAAVTIARQGGHARFFGVVGDDETGAAICRGLEDEGVDVSAVRVVEDRHSPESDVFIDDMGERLIVNHASDDLFDMAAPIDRHEIGTADAVLVDMRWPVGAIAALDAAESLGVPGIVDCDHDPADAPGVLEAASHVVYALPTLVAMTGEHDPAGALRSAAKRSNAWMATTAGAAGTYWIDDGAQHHEPATEVQAVDTLGAGDVFHGTFALALARGSTLPNAIDRASAAAALKCTRFGGRIGIPTHTELERFLEER